MSKLRGRPDKDKTNVKRVVEAPSQDPSPLIRAMTNALMDRDIDPFDDAAVIVALITCGFTWADMKPVYDDVKLMTATRRQNEYRNRSRR